DNKPVEVKDQLSCSLFYRVSESNENRLISSFTAVFPDLNALKSEFQIVFDNNAGKKTSEKVDEVMGYLTEFYGKADKDNLNRWLNSNFKF
ncbi:MAG TPA: hypothetical protein PLR45_06130, partial [Flavobacteriales bacterium]|nr:hypothetical protein [Flavobacteriales bacterium]